MVIIVLSGGLGNQMFQYALGLSFSKITEVKFDLSYINKYSSHNGFELNRVFGIIENDAIITEEDRKKIGELKFDFFHRLKNKILPSSNLIMRLSPYESIEYDKKIFCNDNVYLWGYWQSYKYFKEYNREIKKKFLFKFKSMNEASKQIVEKIRLDNEAVSIHIRRGDYINNKIYTGICDADYYNRAITYIKKILKNPHFYIFSNDIEWCKKNIILKKEIYYFVDYNHKNNSYTDMYIMSLCKINIIANSSFSWWAAWLNSNTDKIVIAPRKWFNLTVNNVDDILPLEWVRL